MLECPLMNIRCLDRSLIVALLRYSCSDQCCTTSVTKTVVCTTCLSVCEMMGVKDPLVKLVLIRKKVSEVDAAGFLSP